MKPEEVVYVGDTDDDANAARAAGMVQSSYKEIRKGNAFDFRVNKHNLEQTESSLDVRTITKLSELLTQFFKPMLPYSG